MQTTVKTSKALKFVLVIGVLSFFADFTYEGSRSIVGPYLALLKASGTVVAGGLIPATDTVNSEKTPAYAIPGREVM